jgi:hypothetical protein
MPLRLWPSRPRWRICVNPRVAALVSQRSCPRRAQSDLAVERERVLIGLAGGVMVGERQRDIAEAINSLKSVFGGVHLRQT